LKLSYNLVIALIALVQLINTADFMLVSVALPSIGRDLAIPNSLAGWVVSINALTYAGFVMLGGRLSDLLGQRRCTIFGLGLFSLGSLLAALSTNVATLLGARAFQGIGNGIMCPATFAMLNTVLPAGPIRNRGYGVYGITQGVSTLIGAGLGGVLTTEFGWRSVFLLTFPLTLGAIAIAVFAVPQGRIADARRPIDYWGAVLVTLATTLVVLGLSSLYKPGWATAIDGAGSLAAGLAFGALFVFVESRIADPLVPMKLFTFSNVPGPNIAIGCGVAGTTGLMVLVNLYMQRVLGFSAMKTGFGIIPFAIGGMIGGQVLAVSLSRFSLRANVLGGFGAYLAGIAFFATLSADDGYPMHLAPGLFLAGFGSVAGLLACMKLATSGTPDDYQGASAGIVYVSQKFGRAIGTSTVLAVLTASLAAGTEITATYRASFLVPAGLLCIALIAVAAFSRSVGKVGQPIAPIELAAASEGR
jgi:MFS family permease